MAQTGVDPVTSRFSVMTGALDGKPKARQIPAFIWPIGINVIKEVCSDLPHLGNRWAKEIDYWCDRIQFLANVSPAFAAARMSLSDSARRLGNST